MKRAAGWGAVLAYTLFGLAVLRPRGDQVLEALSGDTAAGAFLLGLFTGAAPAAAFLAMHLWWWHQRALGVTQEQMRMPTALNAVLLLSLAPLVGLLLMVSRSGSTAVESSRLFEAMFAGLAVWMVPLIAASFVLQAWRAAQSARQHLSGGERRRANCPGAHVEQQT